MTIIYVIIFWTVMVGIASLAVDFGSVQVVQSQLKAAIDAAALAASTGLAVSPTEARNRAKAIAALNTVNGRSLTLLDSDIEFGMWNPTTRTFTLLTGAAESTANGVRVNGRLLASRNTGINLSFKPLLSGNSAFELNSSAVGAAAVDSVDVVLVQDVSGSFAGEISRAKTGDQDLLDSLNVNGTKSKFGIVAFAGTANTVKALTSINGNITTLTSSVSSLSVGGAGMPSDQSGTDIAAGIEKARTVFNNAGAATNARAIIIVSDGEPSPYYTGAHWPWITTASGLLALAQSDADSAWSAGISIYVVFWNDTASTSAANNLKTLVRGKGTFTNVTDPAELTAAIGLILKNQGWLVK